jgi:hypothetical protein
MKPLYNEEVDKDDLLLQGAINSGIVPPGCRVGGAIVQGISVAGGDPCSQCDVKRNLCGGRPKIEDQPVTNPTGVDAQQQIRQSLNDSTVARQQQRKLTIMQLNRMIKEKK